MMDSYTVRVELVEVAHDGEVYKKLHVLMAAKGFHRQYLEEGSTWRELPHAEYIYGTCGTTPSRVAARAKAVAEELPGTSRPKGVEVLVTKWVGRDAVSSIGLPVVDQPEWSKSTASLPTGLREA
jgi:hypothetical protein